MVRIQNVALFALAQLIAAAPPAQPAATDISALASGRCNTFTLYCGHTLKRLGTRAAMSNFNNKKATDQDSLLFRLERSLDSKQSGLGQVERWSRSNS